MKLLLYCALSGLPLLLTACSGFLTPHNAATTAQNTSASNTRESMSIGRLIAQRRYGEAILDLERAYSMRNTPELLQRLQYTKELAENYDKSMSAAIQEAVNKQDWAGAHRLLYSGSSNYPDGVLLREWQDKLKSRQTERIAELQILLLTERAEWILHVRPMLEELAKADSGNVSTSFDLGQVRTEAQKLAPQLSGIGIDALNASQFDVAERCLTLSDKLQPSAENILALERLDRVRYELNQGKRQQRLREELDKTRQDTDRRKQQQRVEEGRQQQLSRRMIDELYSALGGGELLHAQELLEQLRIADKSNPQLASWESAVASVVVVRVDELTVKGDMLYSNGDIEAAKSVWDEALKLNPENTRLRNRVSRAEQVLNNLRSQQPKKTVN